MIEFCISLTLKKRFREQRNRLFRLALAWTGDAMLSDDLVQECLARAWEKRQQLKDPERLEAWLFRILHNCWMEHLRRMKATTDLDEVPPDLEEGPDSRLERQQLADRVRAAVARLPVGQREVVTLVDLEECRYAEVAEILEIPIGTVMSRLSRARRALRDELLHLQAPREVRQPLLRRVK